VSDTREKIVDEAFKLFLQNSYKEVAIQDIVDKVGLTKGAFYYFFKSKEQLFREIFNHFFLTIVKIDYSKYSHHSLYQFYHDVYNHYVDTRLISKDEVRDFVSNLNYYTFIFEALRLFPDLQHEVTESQLSELKSWQDAVRNAIDSGEIKSVMSDRQIAGIFINISNGVGMQSIMEGAIQKSKEQILEYWDAFYASMRRS
jgi:Transcriptional regulator